MKLMSRLLVLFCALFICTLPVLANESKLWEYTLPEEVTWNQVTTIGTLLVGTKTTLYCFDPANGNIIWKRDDLGPTAPFNVREVPGTPVLFVNDHTNPLSTQTRLFAVNILTGESLWETEKLLGQAIGAYPFPERNLILVFFSG
ncbi:MAG: PQQ-binding-like beta-propeller repeat protein, partial [Proteobacteria bacterium]|nr:PQQ-binding-like beta-propeller repeat protein [Pseudomonadota bacterium]